MPRRSRLNLTDVPQHIIQRGSNRQTTFFAEEDYRFYLERLVDTEAYFLRCCRYIECNPVRAQMVADPGDYPWSSYLCHAFGKPDKLVTTHEQYHQLGQTAEDRHQAYRELFRSELDSNELGEIRDTVNSSWPLGNDRFKDEIESALKCAVRPPKRGRPVRSVMPSEQSKPFG